MEEQKRKLIELDSKYVPLQRVFRRWPGQVAEQLLSHGELNLAHIELPWQGSSSTR